MYVGLRTHETDRLHPDEHLTLVWMGKFKEDDYLNPYQEDAVDLASIITNLINRYCRQHGPIVARVTACGFIGNSRAAFVHIQDPILYTFRELCERLGLNHSQYKDWKPHISAPSRALLRPPGTLIQLTHAEMR